MVLCGLLSMFLLGGCTNEPGFLIIMSAGLVCLLLVIMIVFLLIKNRFASRQLENLVSERTRELALQTATLTAIFDTIPSHIFIKDRDFIYRDCNQSMADHFGLDKEGIIGTDSIAALGIDAVTAERLKEIDSLVISENRKIVSEGYIPRHDGTKPLFEIIKMPFIVEDETLGVITVSYDMTEQMKKEQSSKVLAEYAKKLSEALAKITKSPAISIGDMKTVADLISSEGCTTLDASNVGIWFTSEDNSYLTSVSYYDSKTNENTVQGNFDLVERQKYADLLFNERLIVMTSIEECDTVFHTEGEAYISTLCAALDAPIRVDGKVVGVICVEQSINDKYKNKREWSIEEQSFASSLADLMALAISGYERRMAREEAEEANRFKSTFLANMSHEIRTPMNAILGITEILMQSGELPTTVEEGLGKIYSSCDLLLGIINDILDFSKIEAGNLDVTPIEYSTASLINDSVQLNLMRVESKLIEFEVDVDENIPARLRGDELRIKQILNNLLSNAFKYTASGKVSLIVSTTPAEDRDNHLMMTIEVRDTGIGMSEQQLRDLYSEFVRFSTKTSRRVEGTGLGLVITERLVNLMEGTINAVSEVNEGTTFTVTILQEIVPGDVLGKEVVENLRKFRMANVSAKKRGMIFREPMPYGHVLVVDDVETNLYVASGLLKPYYLQVDVASGGQEAIDIIKGGKTYNVIFMDHMMPQVDGIEATRQIREWGYTLPIVALTANAVAGQDEVFLKSGFDDFISKPIDTRHLNSVLNRFIRDRQPLEIIEAARSAAIDCGVDTGIALLETLSVSDVLLASFIRDAHRTLVAFADLTDFDDSEVVDEYTIYVHGMKNSLWNIGEKELSEDALELEYACREKNYGLIKPKAPIFEERLRSLLERLEATVAANSAEAPVSIFAGRTISGVDIPGGIKRYDDDEKTYLKILRTYVTSIRSMLDVLDSVTEETLHDYEIRVHGIKGASTNMYARQIGETAGELEEAAKNKDLTYILEHNPPFMEELHRHVLEIDNLLAEISSENEKTTKSEIDVEILRNMKEACQAFYIDGADEALEELEKYSYEKDEDNALLIWLRESLDMMRFSEIVERLSN